MSTLPGYALALILFFGRGRHTMFPHLHVLVKGDYAVVDCVPNETDAGLMAFSDGIPTDLPPDGISIFYTNTPTEEIEFYNDYVIPKTLAWTVVKDFVETGEMSNCVEWEEL